MSNPFFINKVHAAWTSVMVMYWTTFVVEKKPKNQTEKHWLKGVSIIKE